MAINFTASGYNFHQQHNLNLHIICMTTTTMGDIIETKSNLFDAPDGAALIRTIHPHNN